MNPGTWGTNGRLPRSGTAGGPKTKYQQQTNHFSFFTTSFIIFETILTFSCQNRTYLLENYLAFLLTVWKTHSQSKLREQQPLTETSLQINMIKISQMVSLFFCSWLLCQWLKWISKNMIYLMFCSYQCQQKEPEEIRFLFLGFISIDLRINFALSVR